MKMELEADEITDNLIDKFIDKLRLQKFETEQEKAEESLVVLEHIVTNGDREITAKDLISRLRNVENQIVTKMPWETTPCNMVQRVIKIARDEYNTCLGLIDAASVHTFSQDIFSDPVNTELPAENKALPNLKKNILDVLSEYKAEVEECLEPIASQGESKIHNDEVIMTCGFCPTVLAFLLRAAKKRQFHVIVAECAPKYDGHKMAKSLSNANIQTMLIQDCAIFSLMSRVNKVIIGTQTVLSNGGIKTFVGASSLATAAKFYSVPLYVCCPTYKFSLSTCEEVNHYDSPNLVLPTDAKNISSSVNVAVAKFDYVPPEHVTSFITNNSGIAPSYVYRLLSELYHPTLDNL